PSRAALGYAADSAGDAALSDDRAARGRGAGAFPPRAGGREEGGGSRARCAAGDRGQASGARLNPVGRGCRRVTDLNFVASWGSFAAPSHETSHPSEVPS